MIIFDLDGTLWDTIDTTYKACKIFTHKREDIKEISKKTVKKGMGLNLEDNAKNYMPDLPKEIRENNLKEINKITITLLKNGQTKFYLGMKKTIKNLSKKYKLGIVTNNNDDYAKTFLETSGLKEYFTDYMGATSYNITKGEAIRNLLIKNKEEKGYYVGDTQKDKEASADAGVTFIHASYGVQKEINSLYKINHIYDLPKLLDKLGNK